MIEKILKLMLVVLVCFGLYFYRTQIFGFLGGLPFLKDIPFFSEAASNQVGEQDDFGSIQHYFEKFSFPSEEEEAPFYWEAK